MLRICLFGNPQLFDGDKPISITPVKALLLLAYLLLKRSQPVPRDQVAFVLWPDVSESEARANLRRHLHLLHKQLPAFPKTAAWVLTTRNTVQWNPDAAYWLDVALLDQFDEAGADEQKWMDALDSYRGELLEGYYEEWIIPERLRLHQRYMDMLERYIARLKSRGDWQAAIRAAQRLLVHDALREEPYRYLMELYYRAGDRAAALREFEKCQAMLRDELGVEPMPETLALRAAIADGRPLAPLRVDHPPVISEPLTPLLEPRIAPPAPLPPGRRPERKSNWRRWPAGGALLAILIVAGLWGARALSFDFAAETATLAIYGPTVVQDTWITSEFPDMLYDPAWSDTPFAANPQVHLAYFNYPQDRVLVHFDLRQIPPNARITQAVFHIYLETFTNEDLPRPLPAVVSVFRILRPWQADTATFNSPWSKPGLAAGVDYADQPLASQPVTGTARLSFDVSGTAQDWLAHPDENHGLMLMITEAPRGAHYWVDTTDYPIASRQPRLDLTYTH